MKKNHISKRLAVITLGIIAAVNAAVAQQAATTTTTVTNSAGTVSAFDPATSTIAVTTEEAAAPVSYRYSEQTTIVDETGAPVAASVINSGVPVTVYYGGTAEARTVSKIVVRRAVPATSTTTVVQPAIPVVPVVPATKVTEETTTTTTTTND